MKLKDSSVEMKLHWHLTNFLTTKVNTYYHSLTSELTITSGSELSARHGYTSLHYALPCCAVDIRNWDIRTLPEIVTGYMQWVSLNELAGEYCADQGLGPNDIDVVLEKTHIHIEFQPKRPETRAGRA